MRLTSPGVNRLLLSCLTVLAAYHVTIGGTFRGSLTGEVRLWNLLLFGGLGLACCYAWARGHLLLLPPSRPLLVMLLAMMWEGLASALSEYPRLSVEVWGTRLGYVAATYAAFVLCSTASRRSLLVSAVLVASIVPLGFAVREFLVWRLTPLAGATIHDQRQIASTLNHSNDFATYLSLLIPLTLGVLTTRAAAWCTRVLAAAYLVSLLFFLGLTLSRSGWLAGMVALAVFLLLEAAGNGKRTELAKRLARNGMILALAFACFRLPAVVVPRLTGTPAVDWQGARMTMGDSGVQQRLGWWSGMWRMVRERPLLGWGDGLIALTFPRYATATNEASVTNELPFHAHNLFVQMAVEGGLVGCFLWCALLVLVMAKWWRSLHSAPDSDRPLLIAMGAAVLGYAASGLGQSNLATPCIHVVPMLLLGALARSGRELHHPVLPPAVRYGLASAAAVVLSWFILWQATGWNLAHRYFDEAMSMRASSPERSLSLIAQAQRLDPRNACYAHAAGLLSRRPQDYRRAIRLYSNDPVFHANLGWLLVESGDAQGGALAFGRALRLDPLRHDYWLARALAYQLPSRGPSPNFRVMAREALEQALEIIPPDPRVQWQLALQEPPERIAHAVVLARSTLALLPAYRQRALHIPVRHYRVLADESLLNLPAPPTRAEVEGRLREWQP